MTSLTLFAGINYQKWPYYYSILEEFSLEKKITIIVKFAKLKTKFSLVKQVYGKTTPKELNECDNVCKKCKDGITWLNSAIVAADKVLLQSSSLTEVD